MFDVSLATQPSAVVTVTVGSGDTGAVTVSDTSLVFTTGDWGTAQSVTVTGVDDDDARGETVNVSLSAGSTDTHYEGKVGTVVVTVTDNDTPDLVAVESLTIVEGGTGSFEVVLATQPSAVVTVTIGSGDTGAVTVTDTSLVFTTGDWGTAQSVMVSGVEDADANSEAVNVSLSAGSTDTQYEGITGTVVVTVTDNDTANLVISDSSLTVAEDGTGSFEVSLATQPSAVVTVTVGSGDTGAVTVSDTSLVFTTGDWGTAQSVTVTGVDDDDARGETVNVSLSAGSTDRDYEGKVGTVVVTVTDNDTADLVISDSSLTVAEDGTVMFDVSLATQPSAVVTVTVGSGDTGAVTVSDTSLVFTTGDWGTAQSVTVTGVDDDDARGETVDVSLSAGSTDTQYEGKAGTVVVTVTDNDSPDLVAVESLTVAEEGTVMFDVSLATQPSAVVTVTVGSGDTGAVTVSDTSLVFTTGDWGTAQSVTVTGVDDDDARGETVNVSLSAGSTDTHYEGKVGTVVVTVTDNDTPDLVAVESLTIVEGGTGSFEVVLATQPSAVVTVTVGSGDTGAVTVTDTSLVFTTGDWGTAQSVMVSGVEDADANSEAVNVSLSAGSTDTQYEGITGTVVVTVTDNDTANLVISDSSLTVAEDGTGSFEVSLATQPSAVVTVTVGSGDTGAVTVSDTSLVFTTGDWGTAQSVTVTGVDDDDARGETVNVSLSAGSTDRDYEGKVGTVVVTVTDNDTADLVISDSSLTVAEDGTVMFDVSLATQPSAVVTVTVGSGDTGAVTVSDTSLVFTTGDWGTAQSVTVTGVDDDDARGETVDVSLSAGSTDTQYEGKAGTVVVTVTDNDSPDLVAVESLTVAEEGTVMFDVSLATQPSAVVTVTVGSGDTGAVTVSDTSLVFTTGDWGTAQSVTVTGVDDDDARGETVNVSLSAGSTDTHYEGKVGTVVVTVTDNDTPDLVAVESLTIVEGGTGSFEVVLATQPSAVVTVTIGSGDTGAVTVTDTSLVFTTGDWGTAQSVMVSGVEDADANSEAVNVSLSAGSTDTQYEGITGTVVVTVTDNDTANLVISDSSLTVAEDGTGSFEVSLATQPSAVVTVTVGSGDTGAVTVSDTSLVFTTGDWGTAQSVTVTGVDDDDARGETVNVSLSAGSTDRDYEGKVGTVVVTVTDNDTADLVISDSSLTVAEDGTVMFDVSLATQPSAVVTVTVGSGDTGAVTVSDTSLVFTTGDWGTAQSVTVTGVDDDDARGETVDVSLSAGSTDTQYEGKAGTVVVTVTDNDSPDLVAVESLTVAEEGTVMFDVSLATQPSAVVTVTVGSGDTGAVTVSDTSLVFTTGDWGTAQSVTVTGVDDDDARGETVNVSLSAGSTDTHYEGKVGTVVVTVTDNDTPDLVAVESLTIVEGGTGSFEVVLATQPSAVVTVTIGSGDTGAVTVTDTSLVFTTGDWGTAQSVMVSGVEDADANSEAVNVSLSAGSTDTQYEGITGTVVVTVTDNDTANLVISDSSLTVAEDGTGSFEVSLATQPSAVVTVTVGSGDTGAVTVSDTSLVFTTGDWGTAQSVTVTGVDDDDARGETVNVSLSAGSTDRDYEGKVGTVVVTVTDNDTADLVISDSSLTVAEDGTVMFDVSLATQPSAVVTVTVGSGDTGAVTVSDTSLVFTTGDWGTAQSVTVTGVDDDDARGETVDVSLSAGSTDTQYEGKAGTVVVTVTDNDSPDLVAVESLTVAEEGTVMFDVSLATQPSAVVTVTVGSGDTGAVTVSDTSLVFTTGDWGTAQSVTVTGVDDDDARGETVNVSLSAGSTDTHMRGRLAR